MHWGIKKMGHSLCFNCTCTVGRFIYLGSSRHVASIPSPFPPPISKVPCNPIYHISSLVYRNTKPGRGTSRWFFLVLVAAFLYALIQHLPSNNCQPDDYFLPNL
jgi:hypothetical protein